MIVVIGSPLIAPGDGPERADGPGPRIARAASRAGAAVQLVGKVGDDPEGDATLLALAQGGIGHVAVLRDAVHRTPRATVPPDDLGDLPSAAPVDTMARAGSETRPGPAGAVPGPQLTLDAGDLELALRYLVDYRVVVVAEPLSEAAGSVVAEAASFTSAQAVVLVEPGGTAPAALSSAIVLEGPELDEGPFADLVGRLAAALDRGDAPAVALEDAIGAVGWEPIGA